MDINDYREELKRMVDELTDEEIHLLVSVVCQNL